MPPPSQNSWFPHYLPLVGAKSRLFCFPTAGGKAAEFNDWPERLPGVEVMALTMPHEWRETTSDAGRVQKIVANAAQAIRPFLNDLPFSFFGNSFGAAFAYEVICELLRQDAPTPQRLVMASMVPPHLIHSTGIARLMDLSGDELFDEVERLFDFKTPDGKAGETFRSLARPIIRALLANVLEYAGEKPQKLDIPIHVACGSADQWCTWELGVAWESYTRMGFAFDEFEGGHLFALTPDSRFMSIIAGNEGQRPLL